MKHDKFTNDLINEKSTYLLQHAHNPVDWYPWGKKAFQKAKEENRPIFLSIGYSTCHWCHVMERESFENEKVATELNKTFVNIKVDREELPEVDLIYMEFAQSMMSGAAGWPLNVILTPNLEPFFATTYLPPTNHHGLIGLMELIERIRELWQSEEKENILFQAKKIVDAFKQNIHTRGDQLPSKELISSTLQALIQLADPIYGGIKGAPKFPLGYQLNCLLRSAKYSNDVKALFLTERTLEMMHRGGIYDHVGGGFSRYSTDERWLVPHFEKMLYDNAILIYSYLEGWLVTKKPELKAIVEETITYVLRDMLGPDGGFYSAEDADSNGVEGLFYTWEYEEIIKLLREDHSEYFREFYGISKLGNFEGRNILNTPQSLHEFAIQKEMEKSWLETKFKPQLKILYEERKKRIPPLKDDKILTSSNGLMIFSLVEAGMSFQNRQFVNAAIDSANFIKKNMWKNETLLRCWRKGEAEHNSSLDEYAYLIRGLISLFEADCGLKWLKWAIELTHILSRKFKAQNGAFYYTDGANEDFIIRKCQYADGAEPSGNAVHCENLIRLYQITFNPHYLNEAEDILMAVKKYLESYPPGYVFHLMNLQHYWDKQAPTIVIALNDENDHYQDILNAIYENFIPHRSVIVRHAFDEELINFLPHLKEQNPIDNKTTLYICSQGVCKKPLNSLDAILNAINSL